ncbi:MAG: lipopolysaccharide biosynthesis protein, partial [Sinorhizobium fredii]|nr:lipopolysaccharide biosynthesis protein [Sinorhizobium fredii]
RVLRVLGAATGISLAAALTVFVLAPVLPYLFGHEYVSLVGFVRGLAWVVVPLAIWSVAVEALGASGYHAARATVMGLGSIAGAGLAAAASWYAPPAGTFVSFYVIEIAMVVATWSVFLRFVRRDRERAAREFPAGTVHGH